MSIEEARAYVATDRQSGGAQLALLIREGLRPDQRVLEYGCGTLHLARVLSAYLDPGPLCVVEPNLWLVKAALDDDEMLAERLDLWVHATEDFDATSFGQVFDFVFAHSIMSHAASWQLGLFLRAAKDVLSEQGRIIASLRVGDDTHAPEWVYPGVSFFSHQTIITTALDAGLLPRARPDLREFYSAIRPDEIHDWYDFRRA